MKYLSDLRKDLPENCLFDKGRVGCGGTTLALTNDEPYIICVPFQSLVENKVAQYPEGKLLGVMEGVGIMDIKYYLRETEVPKIIVTYDSLPKVIGCINPKNFKILIDEYHILLTQYSFRSEAVQNVLNHYKDFKTYCFMTATPIEDEFVLDELKDIPIVRQDWDDTIEVKVTTIKCTNVEASAIKLINSFLTGANEGNAYLFLNSTKAIRDIIKKLKLTSENTRVIYSKSNGSDLGIARGTTLDKPKKINFLTSTAFEGSDIYDEDGRTFIISDPNNTHSLLDISTSVQQIAGRIRNSKYAGNIYHLYKETRYSKFLTFDEFKTVQKQQAEAATRSEVIYNGLPEEQRKDISSSNPYMTKSKDNIFNFDKNLVLIDTFNYKVLTDYSLRISINEAYKNHCFTIAEQNDITRIKDLDLEVTQGKSFKDIIKEIRDSKDCLFSKENLIKKYTCDYPFLKDAIEKLGFEKIASLKYVQKDIKNALIAIMDKTKEYKIVKALNLKTGDFISKKLAKKKLADIYMNLGITDTAKSTDLKKYFKLKETKYQGAEGYTIILANVRIL